MATPEQDQAKESRIRAWAKNHLTAEQARKVMQGTIDFAARAGRAAGSLLARLRNEKTPDDMLKAIDDSLTANRCKSSQISERAETLYKTIVQRKKVYESAPPARKKILEMELRNLMAEYKGVERELTAFYDNEHSLNVVRGRLLELMAHGMRQLEEDTIDKLSDDIEEAVSSAEGVRAAASELDKVGKRRERESDQQSFADALAGFDALPEDETQERAMPAAEPPATEKPQEPPLEQTDKQQLAEPENKEGES